MNISSSKRIQDYIIYFDRPSLGKGGFGEVYLCHNKHTKEQFAIKIIEKATLHTPYYVNALFLEIQTHRSLSHPNIIKFRISSYRFIDHFQTNERYYIVLELCQGSLTQALINLSGRITQKEAIQCIEDVARAFSELLKKGIVHRDLKPDNLLLKDSLIKLGDFGFAKKVLTQRQLHHSYVGTPMYMSPQILFGEKYNSKCDVWSLGLIFFQLIYGYHPYMAQTEGELIKNIQSKPLTFPNEPLVSDKVKLFLQQTIKISEQERLSWMQIFSHEMFQGRMMQIAISWKKAYQRANHTLKVLSSGVCLELLIGIFFRFQSPTLDFQQFTAFINAILKQVDVNDIPIMYECFDKDCNGVIDIEQFVCCLVECDKRIPKMICQLIEEGNKLQDLKKQQQFIAKVKRLQKYPDQVIKKVYLIISRINLA